MAQVDCRRRGGLVPSTPDYETIGEFYDEIRSALAALGKASGEDAFVASSQVRQLSPDDIQISGLRVIRHMDDALRALEAIVEQGEGSSCEKEDCHYRRFLGISREWDDALHANPGFVPYHAAAALLDFGNALYGLTLTLLLHTYAEGLANRRQLIDGAMRLMHALSATGSALASMPAAAGADVNAGLTFAVPRNLHSLPPDRADRYLHERLEGLCLAAAELAPPQTASIVREVADLFGPPEDVGGGHPSSTR